jgi:glycosyltransferase involved in cell wall biosynthesis
MHILFLSDNFPPEVNAPASRTYEHCREWVKAGHTVTVITCAPNFPKGEVFEGYSNRLWQRDDVDGIRVVRVWSYITPNEAFAKRVLDYMSYMVMAFVAAFFVRRVDVIVGTSPQFFTVCAAYGVSLVKRRPWLFELRDIWPESISAVGAMKSGWLLDALEGLELFLYRKAAAIVSVTQAFRTNLVTRGIDPEKIHVVTNGVDCSRFAPLPKDKDLLERHGLPGYFVAGYIGTHGMAHGLDTLIDAAALLQESRRGANVRLVMVGDGADRQRLEARAKTERLNNVIFVDSVPKEDVTRYWSLLDAAIIHLRKTELFRAVIPSKLFECMGMGVPVLLGVQGESEEIVKRHDVGIVFEPENPGELVNCIFRLQDEPLLSARLSRNGSEAARHYDRKALAQRMLEIIARLRVSEQSDLT